MNKLIKDSPIGIGCAYLTAGSLTKYDERLIAAVMEEGALHFDVAPQYGLGTAERVLGRAISGNRQKVSITTKVGIIRPNIAPWKLLLRGLLEPIRGHIRQYRDTKSMNIGLNVERKLNFHPEYINRSLDESLGQLQTDYIDVYLLHMPRLEDINEDVIRLLQELKTTGKVNAIGLATDRAETEKILASWPNIFDVVQYSWSVLDVPLVADEDKPFLITHRALSRAFQPMSQWLNTNNEVLKKLSEFCDTDFSNSTILSQALVGAALVENAKGQILVASRSIERSLYNVQMAKDPQSRVIGKKLLDALSQVQNLPRLKE